MRLTLGILTALGGLVDVGNLVANPQAGARYGMSLTVFVVVGALGVMLYSEMAGRVTAVTGRAGFEFMGTGLGRRLVLVNLVATVILTVAMAGGEVGGMAQVLSAWTGGPYRMWLVVGAAALALALVKLSMSTLENVLGLAGLATVVVVASLIAARPHWGSLLRQAARPWPPPRGSTVDYLENVVAQIGSMIIPYQLVFFSSGVAEEEWGPEDVGVNRWNVFVGYGLGAVVALALMANAAVFYAPRQVQVAHLSQVVAFARLSGLGGAATALLYIGMLAATLGASVETSVAVGYSVSQRQGWHWGIGRRASSARRFYLLVVGTLGAATVIMLAGVDPIQITDFTLVISAVALPLTYLPSWLAARQRRTMGSHANRRPTDWLAGAYFVGICVVAVAAVPLWILAHTGA